jgi:hypothetical protein
MKFLTEKNEYSLEVYFASVGYKKLFDIVKWHMRFYILYDKCTTNLLLKNILEIYAKNTTK